MPSPLAPLSGLVSGLLDRSRAGFRWLKPDKQALTVGVVVFVTLATTLGIVALGAAFDATIDREVTVDNPDYPPESTCETFGGDGDSVFVEQCDRPERIDVDVGEELRSASGEYVGYALIGVPIWWAIFALALHGGRASLGIRLSRRLVRHRGVGDRRGGGSAGRRARRDLVRARDDDGRGDHDGVDRDRDRRGHLDDAGAASGGLRGRDLGPVGRGRRRGWKPTTTSTEGSRGQSRASSRCSGSCSQRV